MPEPVCAWKQPTNLCHWFFQEVPPRKKVETPVLEKDPRKRKAAKSSGPSGMGNPGQGRGGRVGWFGVLWRGMRGLRKLNRNGGWPPSPWFLGETLESYKKGGMKWWSLMKFCRARNQHPYYCKYHGPLAPSGRHNYNHQIISIMWNHRHYFPS